MVGDRVRHLKAPIDENGQLGLDMGGLRKRICSTCYLPTGANITLVYIDEDGDVVTLVDDDDLRDAMRQRLKSFRIDVLMNDDKAYAKSSSQRSTQVLIDSVDTTSTATHNYDDRSSHFLNECPFVADYPVNPTVACFKRNHSAAIAHRWYDSAPYWC